MKRLVLLLLLVLSIPVTSLAWDREGHQAVSAIAYAKLNANQRMRIEAILKFHPWYNTWRTEYQQSHPPHVSWQAYEFVRAAAWPDDIRDDPQFHHGTWHYVNYPVALPSSMNTTTPIGTGILHTQIQACMDSVKNETQTTPDHRANRAIMLSWLFHLVGDLHQPLHSVALVNSSYPQGDHGGNDFYVRPTNQADEMRLHTFWDDVLGTSQTVPDALALALTLMNQTPFKIAMLNGDYHLWINESGRLALPYVYQFRPPGGTLHPIGDHGAVLPPGYETQARLIAARQVAVAGYRLAGTVAKLIQIQHQHAPRL